ncbi:MAG TPA: hypothetical protein VFV23_14070 [Verrucomicrobiae bacterium]|nr:hypothetical protein [Verrucomicrobiae bacterium]
MKRVLPLIALAFLIAGFHRVASAETVSIVIATNASPRVEFGAEKLAEAINAASIDSDVLAERLKGTKLNAVVTCLETIPGRKIWINHWPNPGLPREGFSFALGDNNDLSISSADDSGALYGCLELAKRIREEGKLPTIGIANFHDAPAMKLRGTCIGLQKTYILPGRHVYEYPITPELFPWFYDKKMWKDYLDFLAENRMNTLYLWSGHPFASLVRLKDYPYAVEVPDDVFAKNQEMYHWLASECDKRGIWLVQMFYNIIVSKPFAETNGISTQLSGPTPLVTDYTRKSIAEFVKDYPNIGLLVCLGEALRGTDNQLDWCTNAILPGVLDGMKQAGLKEEPPIIIRTHAMDPYAIMPAAYQMYSNLFTMSKYNGESLTTWEPRGKDADIHRAMSKLGPHIVNVHILSNLEPFRYGDVDFIKKCVQASRDRLDASGVHLYPLSYWNWPYSPDIATPPELQWQRDWIWFTAWARYSWNPDIPEKEDHAFWISQLAEKYGNTNAAEKVLEAYDVAGEVAPRLIRRFGITEGNRQTLSLGMTLDELVHPNKYGAIEDLWLSQSPPGERLDEFVRKEWNHQPHVGETPDSIIADVLAESSNAVAAADAAQKLVTHNRSEFERLRNDAHCVQAMAQNYADKVRAAELVLRYNYSAQIGDMEQAEKYLAQSFADYEKLVALTKDTYQYANSMQTSQRKIPVSGGVGGKPANYLWSQLVPVYQKELDDFRARVAALKANPHAAEPAADESQIKPWPAAPFTLISTNAETYTVEKGAKVFTDRGYEIQSLAPELRGLTGIRFSHSEAKDGMTPIEFEAGEPVYVLVGYFDSKQKAWLQVPQLETAAQADERGGVDTVIAHAAAIASSPSVDVHAFRFDAGKQKLELIGKGSFVVLGIVPQTVKLEKRDAHR